LDVGEKIIINSSYAATEQIADGDTPHYKICIDTLQPTLKIASGQDFILANNVGHNDLLFKGYGSILEVSKPTLIPLTDIEIEYNLYRKQRGQAQERPKNRFTLFAKTPSLLEKRNRLQDLSFSLSAVDRFVNPQVQFRLPHRTLNPADYETVTKGLIYVARTAFGKFANALPKENQLEFTLLAIKQFKDDSLIGIESIRAFELLHDYIETRILQRGRMLVAADDRMQRVFAGSSVPVDRIGYRDEHAHGQPDIMHTQAEKFRRIFAAGNLDILNKVRDEIAQNRYQEERFEWIFRSKRWPLRLDE
jgi:hypothetical protein